MYAQFFGLKAMPFDITPDPDFMFFGKTHHEALFNLLYGIRNRNGFMELTGDVGTGKTTLYRALLTNLAGEVESALISNPTLSAGQLLQAIVEDFKIEVRRKDRKACSDALNEFLLKMADRGSTAVLILDEAQDLKPAILEQIRLLSNFETNKAKLLQIILVGQPELRDLLAQPSLRQIRQRITISVHLSALDRAETEKYIAHRIKVAGGQGMLIFDSAAVDEIFRCSAGNPRLINILCDKTLLMAYQNKSGLDLKTLCFLPDKQGLPAVGTSDRLKQAELRIEEEKAGRLMAEKEAKAGKDQLSLSRQQLEAALSERDKESELLKQQTAKLAELQKSLDAREKEHLAEVAALRESSAKLEDRISRLDQENDSLTQAEADARKRHIALSGELDTLRAEAEVSSAKLKAAMEKVRQAELRIEKEEAGRLTAEKEAKAGKDQLSLSRQQLETALSERDKESELLKHQTAKLAELQKSLGAREKEHLAEVAALRESSAKLKDRISRLDQEKASLTKAVAETGKREAELEDKLETETRSHCDKVKSLESTAERWKALVAQQKAEYDNLDRHDTERLSELMHKIESLEEKLAQARQVLKNET